MTTHKDLKVWQLAMELVEEIYQITGKFPKDEIFGIISQMRRCAVSVPSNIAEGAARNTNKEYLQFIYIGLGSLSELETQMMIAQRLHFTDSGEIILKKIETIRRMLLNLVKYLKHPVDSEAKKPIGALTHKLSNSLTHKPINSLTL